MTVFKQHHMAFNRIVFTLISTGLIIPSYALAGSPPDAGRTLQEAAPPLEVPRVSPEINLQAPEPTEALPGGAGVALQSIAIKGNTLFSEDVLKVVLGDVVGKTYDLAGLKGLANQITAYYRNAGYPFAHAYIPAQPITNGELHIKILEGQYGQVQALGDDTLVLPAGKFLSSLVSGKVIQSESLERAALIVDDLPGIRAVPIIRPGQEVGTGDLDVKIERDSRFGGDVGLDNHGNRYTGRSRAKVNLHADSPFIMGDQVTLNSLYSEEDMWLGSLAYSLPLGGAGLRGKLGYSHTYYELSKDYANLEAHGTAKVSSLGLSYPLLRSQKYNLTLAATYQYKKLNDQQDVASTSKDKFSNSLPVTLNFDLRDSLAGGGVTYGSIAWTHGTLNLDQNLKDIDLRTAKTNGDFDKVNLDIARLQALPNNFTLYGRISTQWAVDNLDSSEDFGLGGANGVRAYPSGEGYGDEGWLAQIELRYSATLANATVSPYAFYDSGSVRINHRTWDNAENKRSVTGAGLGVRANYKDFNLDSSFAWRTFGGIPQSDTKQYQPMVWVNAGYKF